MPASLMSHPTKKYKAEEARPVIMIQMFAKFCVEVNFKRNYTVCICISFVLYAYFDIVSIVLY